jgi:uncharacterized protein YunC (DUF1805 family)
MVTDCADGYVPATGEKIGVAAVAVAIPAPVIVAVCGEFAALSATDKPTDTVAVPVGVKVYEKVQKAPAASVAPQLLDSAKALGVGGGVKLVMLNGALPGFERMIVWIAEVAPTGVPVKVSVDGVRTACGAAAAIPVPVMMAACGEFAALSATDKPIETVVVPVGVKVYEKVQNAPAATVAPQLLDSAKALGVGGGVKLVILNGALPGFERTMVLVADVVPTCMPVKVSVDGVRTACGAAAAWIV